MEPMSAALPVNRILKLVLEQGADELRLGTDRAPRMLSKGAAKRLTLSDTTDETLRILLGELLSPERDAQLRAKQRVDTEHAVDDVVFHVAFQPRASDPGFDVVFTLRRVATSAPVIPSAAPESARAVPVVDPAPRSERTPRTAGDASRLGELVARVAALRGSDLHVADDEPVRVRVDGTLRVLDDTPADVASLVGLSEEEGRRLAAGHALDLRRDLLVPVRVHVYATAAGLSAAIRLLDPEPPSLASLGFPIADLAEAAHGLVLACGPAGSGKSTTLAALAQHALRKRSVVLVTLEDPIEYTLVSAGASVVRRRQIGVHAPSFAQGLRDGLREDLNVLLVGELRDPETIRLAVTAAETGHLVLASVHARSASSAITRLLDAYPAEQKDQARGQIADSLRAVLAQRLLPRTRRGGRVAALEILRTNAAVGSLVREGKQAQLANVMHASRGEGMATLERALADLVNVGEVTRENAFAAANDTFALNALLERR